MILTKATEKFLTKPDLFDTDVLCVDLVESADRVYFQCEIKSRDTSFPEEYFDIKHYGSKGHQFSRRPGNPATGAKSAWDSMAKFIPSKSLAGTAIKWDINGWPSYSATNFLHRFPESWKAKGYHCRRVGLTDLSACLIQLWPEKQVVMSTEAYTCYISLLARLNLQSEKAKSQADFKLDNRLPKTDPIFDKFVERKSTPLSDYQKIGSFLGQGNSYALFMEQGTGKTPIGVSISSIAAARSNLDRPLRVLIVCPKQVRLNWSVEIKKFTTVPCAITRVNGNKTERFKQVVKAVAKTSPFLEGCKYSAVITSYDTLANDVDLYCAIGEWDLVIYDESHYFKNHDTNRFKAIKKLREFVTNTVILTGTPITNTLLDLFAQLESLGEGYSGFMTWKGFKDFHVNYETAGQTASGGTFQRILGFENVPMLQERLSRLSYRITKKEAGLNLPDKVYDLHEVTMTEKQGKLYKTLAEQMYAEFEGRDMTNPVTINNVLTEILRLAQVTSGHIRPDESEVCQIDSVNPKVDAVASLINDSQKPKNEKVLVWAVFVEDIKRISERLTKEGIGHVTYFGETKDKAREKAIESFNNDPYCKVFVGHPRAAGAGLNLLGYNKEDPASCIIPETEPAVGVDSQGVTLCEHTYTGHEIFFSNNWSMTDRAQAEDRAHRRGTKMPVRITDIVVPDTIDMVIRDRVQSKKQNAEIVQDIKAILNSLRG